MPTDVDKVREGLRRLFDLVRSDPSSPDPPELVWRGMTGDVADKMKKMDPGELWHNKAYTSTSLSPVYGEEWSHSERIPGGIFVRGTRDGVFMEIWVKNKGVDMSAIAGNYHEMEFLIDHGATFRFHRAPEIPLKSPGSASGNVRAGARVKTTVHQFEEIDSVRENILQYRIQPRQDFSNRFGGSMGDIIVFSADRVDVFLDDNTTVVVERDYESPVTDSLTPAQWRDWKERNNPT